MKPKITIAVPTHNNEEVVKDAIISAQSQSYKNVEILVIDDKSSDKTADVVKEFKGVRLIINKHNLGIGYNLIKLLEESRCKYIVYLCGDDVFANDHVVEDIVNIFDNNKEIGVIGRFFYFFMHGKPGAIGVCRDRNILTNACCPSGMAFKRMPGSDIVATNRIFIEMPSIVAQYLPDWKWTMMEYDTIAARYHPGGNTGTKSSYYTESPTQNWYDLIGHDFEDFPMFVQLKLRSPNRVWSEICLSVKNNRKVLLKPLFWLYSLTAILLPAALLKPMSGIYRDVIVRRFSKIIERP